MSALRYPKIDISPKACTASPNRTQVCHTRLNASKNGYSIYPSQNVPKCLDKRPRRLSLCRKGNFVQPRDLVYNCMFLECSCSPLAVRPLPFFAFRSHTPSCDCAALYACLSSLLPNPSAPFRRGFGCMRRRTRAPRLGGCRSPPSRCSAPRSEPVDSSSGTPCQRMGTIG